METKLIHIMTGHELKDKAITSDGEWFYAPETGRFGKLNGEQVQEAELLLITDEEPIGNNQMVTNMYSRFEYRKFIGDVYNLRMVRGSNLFFPDRVIGDHNTTPEIFRLPESLVEQYVKNKGIVDIEIVEVNKISGNILSLNKPNIFIIYDDFMKAVAIKILGKEEKENIVDKNNLKDLFKRCWELGADFGNLDGEFARKQFDKFFNNLVK